MSARVTVVVPFLDPPPKFFAQALESVAAQTWTDWDLVLVNDGSGPAATSVAEGFRRRFPHRVWLLPSGEGRPLGISAARNAGLAVAQGEYLAMLDADDVWLPRHLERHIEALDSDPSVALVYGDTLRWSSWDGGDTRDTVPEAGMPAGRLEPPHLLTAILLGRAAVPCPCSVTARRSLILAVGGYEGGWAADRTVNSLYEDQVFYTKLLGRHPVLRLEETLDRYRVHSRSVSSKASSRDKHVARRQFLAWVDAYASAELPLSAASEIREAVGVAERRLHHPRRAAVARRVAKFLRRLGGR